VIVLCSSLYLALALLERLVIRLVNKVVKPTVFTRLQFRRSRIIFTTKVSLRVVDIFFF
jgi:hypothetical protein